MMIYLDSAVPDPGQSLVDVLDTVYSKDDYKAALPEPSPPYIEKIRYDPDRLEGLKKIYIRCTMSEFKDLSQLVKEKILSSPDKWDYYELNSSHVPMADEPEKFYRLLLEIVSSYKINFKR